MTAARTPEEVLAEHQQYTFDIASGWFLCRGCRAEVETSLRHVDDEFRAHQAQTLRDAGLLVTPEHDREVAAEAWDQGAHWGFFSTTYSADNPNPYRADRVRRGEG